MAALTTARRIQAGLYRQKARLIFATSRTVESYCSSRTYFSLFGIYIPSISSKSKRNHQKQSEHRRLSTRNLKNDLRRWKRDDCFYVFQVKDNGKTAQPDRHENIVELGKRREKEGETSRDEESDEQSGRGSMR